MTAKSSVPVTGQEAASPPGTPRRPRVLVTLAAYLPGFRSGGPVRTIANLVDQLSCQFDFYIVAADRDAGDTEPYPGIRPNAWNGVGDAMIFYRSPGTAGWRAFLESVRSMNFDLIYLNSFFGTSSLRPLIYHRLGRLADRPILLAPRGEFSAGALALKTLKKRLFIALVRAIGLHRGVTFQASSVYEAEDIRRVLGPVDTLIAANLTGRSSRSGSAHAERRPGDPLRVVFLSRISPKKNLLGALDILARTSCPIRFDIYGVIEDVAHWAQCQERMAKLPSHVTARFRGEVAPAEVEGALAENDLFLFPTFGENYGHVIREALSSGLPVLISDQTPWRNLLELNVGADLPLEDRDAFVSWIEGFSRMTPEQHSVMRHMAREHGDDPETAVSNLEANRKILYAAIVGGGTENPNGISHV